MGQKVIKPNKDRILGKWKGIKCMKRAEMGRIDKKKNRIK